MQMVEGLSYITFPAVLSDVLRTSHCAPLPHWRDNGGAADPQMGNTVANSVPFGAQCLLTESLVHASPTGSYRHQVLPKLYIHICLLTSMVADIA